MNRYKVDGYYWREGSTSRWSHIVMAHTAADAVTAVEVKMCIRSQENGGAFNHITDVSSLPDGECGCIRGTDRCKSHPRD